MPPPVLEIPAAGGLCWSDPRRTALPQANLQLQSAFRRNIMRGVLISSYNHFSITQMTYKIGSAVTNANSSVGKCVYPSSPYTELPGYIFGGIVSGEQSQQFQSIGTFQALVNFMLRQKHRQIYGELQLHRQHAKQLSRACFLAHQKSNPVRAECVAISSALTEAKQTFAQIMQLQASKTPQNVSEAYLTQIMEQVGPLSQGPNPQTFIYTQHQIAPIINQLPLHFRAEKIFHVFPYDTFLQRFSTLFLLKSYQMNQKYAVIPIPEGNIKVMVRFLASFYKVYRLNYAQKRNFHVLVFTQNAMQFIQSEEFRYFYNSVSVKICLIDANCIIQRNPGKYCYKQHELYQFGTEKMEWFQVQQKQLQGEQNQIMDSNYQIYLFIVDMLAIEKRDEVEAALNKAREASKIAEFDICIIYHLDHFARRRGAQKLPQYSAKLKIVILSELNFQNNVDVVQTLLCDEIRLMQRNERFNEYCKQYIKNIVFRPSYEIIYKSLNSINFSDQHISLSGADLMTFNQAQRAVILSYILAILQQEQTDVYISYLTDSSEQTSFLYAEIRRILIASPAAEIDQNKYLANCLKQDLNVLCTRSLLAYLSMLPVVYEKTTSNHFEIDLAMAYLRRTYQFVNGAWSSQIDLGKEYLLRLQDGQHYAEINLHDMLTYVERAQGIHTFKYIPRSTIVTLERPLMLLFSLSSLAQQNGQTAWRKSVVRQAVLRTFRQCVCAIDAFAKKLRFDAFCSSVGGPISKERAFESSSALSTPTFRSSYNMSYNIGRTSNPTADLSAECSDVLNQLQRLQFANKFVLAVKPDLFDTQGVADGSFVLRKEPGYTFSTERLVLGEGVTRKYITLLAKDFPKECLNSSIIEVRAPKHPVFYALDSIVLSFERKFFATEQLLSSLQRVKNNMQASRLCQTIVILCDTADVAAVRQYVFRSYGFMYRYFRFKITSDCLEIIAFYPIQVIVLPGHGYRRYVQQLREMVFKQDIRVYVFDLENAEFQQRVADLPKTDLCVNACRLIPTNEYLTSRIASHLSEQRSNENMIENLLENLDRFTPNLKAYYLLIKAAASADRIEDSSSRPIAAREQYRMLYSRIFTHGMQRIQYIGSASCYLPDAQLQCAGIFAPLYYKFTCRSEKFLAERRTRHLGYFGAFGTFFSSSPLFSLSKMSIYHSFIAALSECTSTAQVRPVHQDGAVWTSIYTAVVFDQRPERRMFAPRCCLMQDVSQFVFQLVYSSNRCVGHVSQVKFNTQDIMYSDQIIHYMDSLHLYGIAHIDLKSISLSMQYARQQLCQSAPRMSSAARTAPILPVVQPQSQMAGQAVSQNSAGGLYNQTGVPQSQGNAPQNYTGASNYPGLVSFQASANPGMPALAGYKAYFYASASGMQASQYLNTSAGLQLNFPISSQFAAAAASVVSAASAAAAASAASLAMQQLAPRIIQNINAQLTNQQLAPTQLWATCYQLIIRVVRCYEATFCPFLHREYTYHAVQLNSVWVCRVYVLEQDVFEQLLTQFKYDRSAHIYEGAYFLYTQTTPSASAAELLQMSSPFALACAVSIFAFSGSFLRPRQSVQVSARQAELVCRNGGQEAVSWEIGDPSGGAVRSRQTVCVCAETQPRVFDWKDNIL